MAVVPPAPIEGGGERGRAPIAPLEGAGIALKMVLPSVRSDVVVTLPESTLCYGGTLASETFETRGGWSCQEYKRAARFPPILSFLPLLHSKTSYTQTHQPRSLTLDTLSLVDQPAVRLISPPRPETQQCPNNKHINH